MKSVEEHIDSLEKTARSAVRARKAQRSFRHLTGNDKYTSALHRATQRYRANVKKAIDAGKIDESTRWSFLTYLAENLVRAVDDSRVDELVDEVKESLRVARKHGYRINPGGNKMFDMEIDSLDDLPPGAKVESQYGDRYVVVMPDVRKATRPGMAEHRIKPRFTDENIKVRRVVKVRDDKPRRNPAAPTRQVFMFRKLTHGMPADPDLLQQIAQKWGAEIVKESPDGNVHVRLPDGTYGFFAPGGGPVRGKKTYAFFKSAASNYEDRNNPRGSRTRRSNPTGSHRRHLERQEYLETHGHGKLSSDQEKAKLAKFRREKKDAEEHGHLTLAANLQRQIEMSVRRIRNLESRSNPTDVKRKFPRDESWYVIRDAMARTLFATAWADAEEGQGRSYGGQDIMDVMPDEVPAEALLAASQGADEIEKDNKAGLVTLFCRAQNADFEGRFPSQAPGALVDCDTDERAMEEFGHYLAMMAMGQGVSWFDDHAEFPLKVPDLDFSEFDLAAYDDDEDDED